jgi:hypothetical protein
MGETAATVQVRDVFEKFRWADRAIQEGACTSLAERVGKEAGAKLRELFEADRAAEIANRIGKPEQVEAATKLRIVEPAAAAKPEVRDKQGNLYRWVNGGYRRVFGVPQLRVVEQRKPIEEPEAEPEPEHQAKPEHEPEPEQKSVVVEVVRDEEDEPPKEPVGSRLGIAPGLVGEVADFTRGSAMYPSGAFAVGGSIPLIGTLIGRRIAGPSVSVVRVFETASSAN